MDGIQIARQLSFETQDYPNEHDVYFNKLNTLLRRQKPKPSALELYFRGYAEHMERPPSPTPSDLTDDLDGANSSPSLLSASTTWEASGPADAWSERRQRWTSPKDDAPSAQMSITIKRPTYPKNRVAKKAQATKARSSSDPSILKIRRTQDSRGIQATGARCNTHRMQTRSKSAAKRLPQPPT